MSYMDFADYYDFLTENVNYIKLANYLEQVFAKYNHNTGITLDLACGTGSLTLELAKRGFDIYGVDMSPTMLSVARQKAYEAGFDILFLCQKMQSIDLYGTIDTCICTLDSLNHITNENDIKKVFEKVSLFMNNGGYFVFDVNTSYKHQKVLGNNTYVYDLPEVFCVWQNRISANNIVNIDLDFFEKVENAYIRRCEHFSERSYETDFLKENLEKNGFRIIDIFDGWSFDAPTEQSERLFFITQKVK